MSTVMTFNSVTSTTMNLTVLDVVKSIVPPQKQIVEDVPGYRGVVQQSKKFIQNRITVKCILSGSTYAGMITNLKALSAYLYSDSDKVLSFDDESDRFYYAQHIDTVIGKRAYRYMWLDLVFVCNDPFAYATSADSSTQAVTADDTSWSITNSGHYYAEPTITITFNGNHSHIYIANNNITDNRFDISKTFVNTDALVVNCKDKTITLNGTYSPAGFGTGGSALAEFILLAPGTNQLQCGTDGGSIDVSVKVDFNKTYLY